MVVAAVVVGVSAVAAAGATAYAGHEAANATKDAANTAANEQRQALTQQEQLNAPYNKIGTDATSQYENLLGIGPNANASTISEALKNTPGYQFTQQQGETGILNAASAAGGVSGNTLTALDQYNTGLADQTYQNALSNAQGAVTIGQNAAAGTGAAIQNTGNQLSTIATNQGNNIANIDIGTAAGISKAIGNGANDYLEMSSLKALNQPGGGSPSYVTGLDGGGT